MNKISKLLCAVLFLEIISNTANAATHKKSSQKKINPVLEATAVETQESTAQNSSSTELKISKNEVRDNKTQNKTQGHFVGLDFILTEARFNDKFTRNTILVPQTSHPANHGYDFGGGLNYKYAFNFDGFFIAPGAFYEHNKTSVHGKNSAFLQRLDIDNRYGLKLDAGYDINRIFAPYLTGGYSRIQYTTRNYRGSTTRISYIKDSNVGDWFYGAGLKMRLSNNFALNAEYNRQNFVARTLVVSTVQYMSVYKTRLDVYKLGISYNF